MNIEDIKRGETYNVRMRVVDKTADCVFASCTTRTDERIGGFKTFTKEELQSIHKIEESPTPPKYDPCRLFREGDEVRPIVHKGRIFSLYWREHIGKTFIVTKSEDAFGLPEVNGQPIDPAYLELVTPVEELERYYIEHDSAGYAIFDRQNVGYVAHFKAVQHPHAKAAAEAERDRLNAEWKEEYEQALSHE